MNHLEHIFAQTDDKVRNEARKLDNSHLVLSQRVFAVPQELLDEAIDVLHDLRRSVCPIEQIRPLSIAETAKALRCRRKEVEFLIDGGLLPFIKRHGRRYILPVDIHRRLREETEYEKSDLQYRKRHSTKPSRPEMQDIDPSLQEFFD